MEVQRPYTGHGTRDSGRSLTMLVYPAGTSSFRSREGAGQPWVTFTSTLEAEDGPGSAERLSLQTDSAPSRPVLYRVGRWPSRPSSVGLDGYRLTVNQGDSLPELASEAAVNGSAQSAWFDAAAASRLVVKVVP